MSARRCPAPDRAHPSPSSPTTLTTRDGPGPAVGGGSDAGDAEVEKKVKIYRETYRSAHHHHVTPGTGAHLRRAGYQRNDEADWRLSGSFNDRPTDGTLTRSRSRHLVTIPRLTQQQTRQVSAAAEAAGGATSDQQDRVDAGGGGQPGSRTGPGVRIGHINAQSLAPKVDLVNSLLESEHLDLLCVSETWLKPEILSRLIVFPGYAMVRRDRAASTQDQRVRGGGVAIIHRDNIHCQVLQTPATSLLETLWLSVSWRGGRPAIVGVVYRPPAGSVSQAVDELQEQLREILSRDKPTYLLGDININILNTLASETRRYETALSELNLTQLINQPTHLLPTPTALDHIITNIPSSRAEVLSTPVSDHQPIVVSAPIGRLRKPRAERTTRSWGRADWNAICLDLLLADWTDFETSDDINSMVDIFMQKWWSVLDRHCPARTRRNRRRGCPWITGDYELRQAMSERDEAYRTWLDIRTPESRAEYRRLRNSVKARLTLARREFLSRQLLSSDRREFWSSLKKFYLAPSDPVHAAQTTSKAEQRARADHFNHFFSSVGSQIAADLSDNVTAGLAPRPPIVVSAAFRLQPATLPELARAVRQMNSTGAVGLDGVPLSAVKRCLAVIGPHLLRIVNASFTKGVFPEAWKTAEVVPILKAKGDINEPSNHRPISLLSHLSKIVEKIVCDQLSRYLSEHNILFHDQYAYRPGHCTEDAVLDAVEWISQNSERGEISSITAADLSKAFDSVDHDVLLSKLGWYGIDRTWFRSYLDGRKQLVRGGEEVLPVRYGVPQGSIAGPILFSLFTNDLHCYLPDCRVIAYADDTQLLDHSLPDPQNLALLKKRVENSLDTLQRWFGSNSLKMNPEKTDFILLGTRQTLKKTNNFQISVAGSVTKPSPSMRLLGVTLDSCLSWEAHIGQVIKRCNAILISLYRFRHHFNQEALKLLIETHVFPHILYCISVWGGATKSQLSRIQKIINFGARIATGGRRRDRIGPALASLGWVRVEQLVWERDLLKVYKSINNQLSPLSIRQMFIPRSAVSTRTTRSTVAGALHLQQCKLSSTQRAFRYRATASWNQLPPAIIERTTLSMFRSSLRDVNL